MVLEIPDGVLDKAGLSEHELLIEFACWMFDTEKLSKFQACKLCGLTRDEFGDELMKRNLPVYRITEEDLRQDLATLEKLGIGSHDRRK